MIGDCSSAWMDNAINIRSTNVMIRDYGLSLFAVNLLKVTIVESVNHIACIRPNVWQFIISLR